MNVGITTQHSRWCTCVPCLLILWQGADTVHRHSNRVYASCCVFMFKKVENPAACEMRSVICFLNAKYMKPAENHCQLCDVYGEHAMSSSVVQIWVQLFSEGHDNEHGDVRNG